MIHLKSRKEVEHGLNNLWINKMLKKNVSFILTRILNAHNLFTLHGTFQARGTTKTKTTVTTLSIISQAHTLRYYIKWHITHKIELQWQTLKY